MQKAKHPSLPEHLLSQLVQKYQFHPHALNLKKVVKDLFDENPPQELAIAIDQFCMAALTEGYAWRQGSPANALHLGRSIELLMELAWLLYEKLGNTKGDSKLPKHLRLPAELLPMPLSAAEYGQPAIFLSWFFEYAPLHQWKQWLNCFMDNAIGSGSVAEELPGPELLQFNGLLKKLVYAVERVRSVAASQ